MSRPFTATMAKRRRRLRNGEIRDLISLTADELTALEVAVTNLERSGMAPEAYALRQLQDKVLSLIPRSKTRLEPDYDALLEAQGFIARPGPKPRVNHQVHAKLVQAIKACRLVTLTHRSNYEPEGRPRSVAPLGFLSGARRYLVAQAPSSRHGPTIKTYRVDNNLAASVTDKYFTRPPDFNLQKFANKAFGVFQRDAEIADAIWRFAPEAAEHALAYQFHPKQTEGRQADESLIMKFQAAGALEMAWYLYQWGDKVPVIAPPELITFVAGNQRNNFPALP